MKKIVFAVALTCFIGFLAERAGAATGSIPATSGMTIPSSDKDDCLATNSYGSVTNNCARSVTYVIGLPSSTSGSATVNVWGYAPNASSNLSCRAYACAQNQTGCTSNGSDQVLPSYGSTQMLSLAPLAIPGVVNACETATERIY